MWSKDCLSHLRDLPFFTWKTRKGNTHQLDTGELKRAQLLLAPLSVIHVIQTYEICFVWLSFLILLWNFDCIVKKRHLGVLAPNSTNIFNICHEAFWTICTKVEHSIFLPDSNYYNCCDFKNSVDVWKAQSWLKSYFRRRSHIFGQTKI